MAFALVQQAGAVGSSPGANNATVTLAPTGAGNALIVVASYATDNPGTTDLTSVTLGGSGTGFAAQARYNDLSYPNFTLTYWANFGIAGGQTSLAVSASGASGYDVQVNAYEVSGGLSSLDKTVFNAAYATSTNWTSTATGTTTEADEFVLGTVAAYNNNGPAFTITGPTSPWANAGQLTINTQYSLLSGYQISAAQSAFTYAGTANVSGGGLNYTAGVATFKDGAPPATGSLLMAWPP